MKLLLLQISLCFILVSANPENIIKDQAWLKNYFDELSKTYDKRVAPTQENNPDSSTKVGISMWIKDISNINDNSMDFSAQFYFRQSWNDSRLRFTDPGAIIALRDVDNIWTPDLFFTTSRDGRLESIVHPNIFLRIKPSGEVFYSIRITLKFSCPMDLRYFPHDGQKCAIRVESYGHDKKDLELNWFTPFAGYDPVGVGNMTMHNFDLIAFDKSEHTEVLTFGTYKVLSVALSFQRKFGFFAIKLYVPFILLVILSFASLWIKAEERSMRMSLLVIILYFMLSISWEVNSTIPPAPYMKGIDMWVGFCKSMVFAIFLEFVAVALISGRRNREVPENKSEILMNMESDSKEQPLKSDTLKSHLCKLVNMFDARNGGKGKRNTTAYRIDRVFRIVFPLIFVLFNAVYWSVYCCK